MLLVHERLALNNIVLAIPGTDMATLKMSCSSRNKKLKVSSQPEQTVRRLDCYTTLKSFLNRSCSVSAKYLRKTDSPPH